MWGEHDGMGWWMIFGSVWVVLFWAVAVWLFVIITDRRGSDGAHRDSALEILKRRYANGEITKDEFEAIRRDIS